MSIVNIRFSNNSFLRAICAKCGRTVLGKRTALKTGTDLIGHNWGPALRIKIGIFRVYTIDWKTIQTRYKGITTVRKFGEVWAKPSKVIALRASLTDFRLRWYKKKTFASLRPTKCGKIKKPCKSSSIFETHGACRSGEKSLEVFIALSKYFWNDHHQKRRSSDPVPLDSPSELW